MIILVFIAKGDASPARSAQGELASGARLRGYRSFLYSSRAGSFSPSARYFTVFSHGLIQVDDQLFVLRSFFFLSLLNLSFSVNDQGTDVYLFRAKSKITPLKSIENEKNEDFFCSRQIKCLILRRYLTIIPSLFHGVMAALEFLVLSVPVRI